MMLQNSKPFLCQKKGTRGNFAAVFYLLVPLTFIFNKVEGRTRLGMPLQGDIEEKKR